MAFLDLSEDHKRGTVSLIVQVQPRARHDQIAGIREGTLKVQLCAPPVENRANEALITFLAGLLKTPKSAVKIRSGERSRRKRVEIFGVTAQQVQNLLQIEA